MSVQEFRAWLEGFIHSINGGSPTDEQWLIILDKISLLYPSKVR